MKKLLTALTVTCSIMTSQAQTAPGDVFATPFNTVHQTAPFSRIHNADYEPAIDRGIAKAKAEIQAIADNSEAPTFENTIVALDRSGKDLSRVLNVFYPILSANADDELMEISMRVTPKLSDYSTSPPSRRCSSRPPTTASPSPAPISKGRTARPTAGFPPNCRN